MFNLKLNFMKILLLLLLSLLLLLLLSQWLIHEFILTILTGGPLYDVGVKPKPFASNFMDEII
ncbi:MAG: hypothetical protein N7Q72_02100, partial [Spiroplasma sp. Tabriz.8]|nr:hypothetical protein [Spiroplasma sp. Tabriz.8]